MLKVDLTDLQAEKKKLLYVFFVAELLEAVLVGPYTKYLKKIQSKQDLLRDSVRAIGGTAESPVEAATSACGRCEHSDSLVESSPDRTLCRRALFRDDSPRFSSDSE